MTGRKQNFIDSDYSRGLGRDLVLCKTCGLKGSLQSAVSAQCAPGRTQWKAAAVVAAGEDAEGVKEQRKGNSHCSQWALL